MLALPDQVAWVLARSMTAAPGARFEYGSGTIHLASVALTRACGMRADELADSGLFAPLGLAPRRWEADHQGYSNGGAGLYLTPRDMQALGHLVLNGGSHQQRQVVSASYVAAMTSAQIATGSGMATPFYGFGWWVGQTADGAAFTLANGWGGQFILVIPAKRLVVTTAALTTGLSGTATMAQWRLIFDILMLGEQRIGQGRENARQTLKDNPALMQGWSFRCAARGKALPPSRWMDPPRRTRASSPTRRASRAGVTTPA